MVTAPPEHRNQTGRINAGECIPTNYLSIGGGAKTMSYAPLCVIVMSSMTWQYERKRT
jgi:hypothetical protein